jgi:hypothetical protein
MRKYLSTFEAGELLHAPKLTTVADVILVPDIEIVVATNDGIRTIRPGDTVRAGFTIMDVRWVEGSDAPPLGLKQQQSVQTVKRLWPVGWAIVTGGLICEVYQRTGGWGVVGLGLLIAFLRTVWTNVEAVHKARLASGSKP